MTAVVLVRTEHGDCPSCPCSEVRLTSWQQLQVGSQLGCGNKSQLSPGFWQARVPQDLALEGDCETPNAGLDVLCATFHLMAS